MADSTTDAPTRTFEGLTIPGPGTFEFDLAHSSVSFTTRHMMVSKVRGSFTDFTGTLTIAEDPLASSIEVTIQTASVETREPQREAHLRSADFFDVDTHPTMTFRSTGVAHRGGEAFTVTGDLTISGVTRSVELQLELLGVLVDPWGSQRLGVTASAVVNREDFGLTYNQVLETGGVLVGKTVNVEIDAELVRTA